MVRRIEAIGVCEDGLEFISELHEHEKDRVAQFLSFLVEGIAVFPEIPIPDDAPEKLKNEAAKNRGKFYRGGSECNKKCPIDPTPIGFEWYEANDRSLLYVWRVTRLLLVIED